MDEHLKVMRDEADRLRAQVKQLKEDLGHRRSNGYTVVAMREAIDKMIADAELAGWLPGCEPPELGVLRHLRQIAYRDHSSDLFNIGPDKK